MFLGWPFWKFLSKILIPQETWLWWRGLLALRGNEEKNSSSLKSLINFKIVSQKYSLRDPFQKLFTKLLSVYSHGSGCEDLFALQGDKKNFLFLLHWNGCSDFETISEMFLGWPLSKIVREIFIWLKTTTNCWHLHVVLLYGVKSSSRKYWVNFKWIWQKCSLGDRFQKLFVKFWFVKKHGCNGQILFSLCGLEEILWKSFWKHWGNFNHICLDWSLGGPPEKLLVKFCFYKKNMAEVGSIYFHSMD